MMSNSVAKDWWKPFEGSHDQRSSTCLVPRTRPSAAGALADLLRGAGFLRIAMFHGGSGGEERIRVLDAWSGTNSRTSIDVVIGTSAFGLGVDQSDVR